MNPTITTDLSLWFHARASDLRRIAELAKSGKGWHNIRNVWMFRPFLPWADIPRGLRAYGFDEQLEWA